MEETKKKKKKFSESTNTEHAERYNVLMVTINIDKTAQGH